MHIAFVLQNARKFLHTHLVAQQKLHICLAYFLFKHFWYFILAKFGIYSGRHIRNCSWNVRNVCFKWKSGI